MKIEVGKKYRNRQGNIVEILKIDAPGDYPVIGYYLEYGGPATFTRDGRFNLMRHSTEDLVSEYIEPFVWEGWIIVKNGKIKSGLIEDDFDQEDAERMSELGTLIKIRITEVQEVSE